MIDEFLEHDRAQNRAGINAETAKIPWRELQRFFAAGKVMYVDPGMDLVETALAVQQDEVAQIETWIGEKRIARVSDEQARTWIEADAVLWAVVVKPWVLVQAVSDRDETPPD